MRESMNGDKKVDAQSNKKAVSLAVAEEGRIYFLVGRLCY